MSFPIIYGYAYRGISTNTLHTRKGLLRTSYRTYNSVDACGYPTTDINGLYIEREHLECPPPERMRISLHLDEEIPKESVA